MKTAQFLTFGCKINQYETEAIREEVLALGYEEVPPSAPADVTVVNTCSVTAEGFAKSRRSIFRAARANPSGRIVVVGCSTPSERRTLEAIPQVALIAGNDEKRLVSSFLAGSWRPGEPPPERRRDPWGLGISRFSDRTRATVKVQDGCDSFCSFCIIPFLRGRSRSRPPEDVVEEVRRLVDAGYGEMVLSGVHIQDYQMQGHMRGLPGLLQRVAAVPGLIRVRLSSMGPRAFTPELAEVLGDPVFCPHWHIPLQAGSDAVLERMRRGYTSDDFRRAVGLLRDRFADPSISTDVIAGFPGETEEDFRATLALSREVGFSKMHVFPYSAREGTLAWKLGGELPQAEVRRRARTLLDLEEELALAYKRRFLGREVPVLVEGRVRAATDPQSLLEGAGPSAPPWDRGEGTRDRAPPESRLEGLSDRYVRVRFPEPWPGALARLRGTVVQVRIDSVESSLAHGTVLGRPAS